MDPVAPRHDRSAATSPRGAAPTRSGQFDAGWRRLISKWWLPPACLTVVVCLTALRLVPVVHRASVFVDEPAWITSSIVTQRLVFSGASPEQWERAFTDKRLGDWGNKNPPVGKLALGLAVMPFVRADDTVDYRWQWGLSGFDNYQAGNLPPQHLLFPARYWTLATGLASIVLLFVVIAKVTGSGWAALAAVWLFSRLPAFEFLSVHVHTDMTMLALSTGALVCLLEGVSRNRLWLLALGSSLAGLACATKFSAGTIAVGFVCGAVLTAKTVRLAALRTVVSGAVLLGSFVLVNPYLYPNPLVRTLHLERKWTESKLAQQAQPELAPFVVTNRANGFGMVLMRGILRPSHTKELSRKRFVVFVHALTRAGGLSAVTLALLALMGWRLRSPNGWRPWLPGFGVAAGAVAWEWSAFGSPTLLAPLGALGLAAMFLTRGSDIGRRRRLVAFVTVSTSTWLLTALWLPMDWARYYLPSIAMTAACWGLALTAVARCLELSRVRPLVERPLVQTLLGVGAAVAFVLAALEVLGS